MPDGYVSIHAPVKGATTHARSRQAVAGVSIHAPVKGATVRDWRRLRMGCFNPRAREGRDAFNYAKTCAMMVSIHAPVKGATVYELPVTTETLSFNPRAREGRDRVGGKGQGWDVVSIHAPVKGATQ